MPSVVTAQTDFSAGEIDVTAKRDDSALVKAACRQMANWRILNTKKVANRPGRRALFLETGRVDEVLMAPGVTYYLCFGNLSLKVRNSAGAVVFTDTARAWTLANVKDIVWAVYDQSVYITHGGTVPRVLTWDGVTTWTAANFAEAVTSGGQKRTIFYRIAPKGITMQPSATTGAVSILFDAAVLVAGMIGTRLRFCGRQLTITGVTSPTLGAATVIEPLPPCEGVSFASDPRLIFSLGDVVIGSISGAKGIVTSSSATSLGIQLISVNTSAAVAGGGTGDSGEKSGDPNGGGAVITTTPGFLITDIIVGPGGSLQVTAGPSVTPPQPVTVWDQEVMNTYRGFPRSVFVDQNRLGFCNFPAVPAGVAWSQLGVVADFYVDAAPTAAFFELVPDKAQVFFVVPGTESNEFVFCDNALWYIPISVTNPLRPGSVQFQKLNSDGCAQVQPRAAQEFITYVNASGDTIMAVLPLGAQTRPYTTRELTGLHSHLFDTIIALAVPTTNSDFPERYMYALNSDGTAVVGKLTTKEGRIDIESVVGWSPWSGGGTMSWIFARAADLLFTAGYAPNGITSVSIVEVLDADYYLDAAVLVNNLPTAMAAPPGKGPLWWIPSGTVELMDQTTRMMGTYTIDADGNIIPQGQGGEDLTRLTLVAGQGWTATLEPFVPPVQAGQDVGQRMKERQLLEFCVYYQNSTGFVLNRLYSGKQGALLPAHGTVMAQQRVLTWNQGEDSTLPPILREGAECAAPPGASYDPRESIVKDTPGPLTVLDISIRVTV